MHLKEEYTDLDGLMANENDRFYVLEEQIDIDVQTSYFKLSKQMKNKIDEEKAISDFSFLYDEHLSIKSKKNILTALASVSRVEAYRLLESYKNSPKEELRDWALLAYNESRMLMESSLSDERQIFISTGMGGRGDMLRYFMVLFPSKNAGFDAFQQKFVIGEVQFMFQQQKAIVDKVTTISDKYISFEVLIPLKTSLHKLLSKTFDSCNQLDLFVDSKFIITNIKAMSETEIVAFSNEPIVDESDFEIMEN